MAAPGPRKLVFRDLAAWLVAAESNGGAGLRIDDPDSVADALQRLGGDCPHLITFLPDDALVGPLKLGHARHVAEAARRVAGSPWDVHAASGLNVLVNIEGVCTGEPIDWPAALTRDPRLAGFRADLGQALRVACHIPRHASAAIASFLYEVGFASLDLIPAEDICGPLFLPAHRLSFCNYLDDRRVFHPSTPWEPLPAHPSSDEAPEHGSFEESKERGLVVWAGNWGSKKAPLDLSPVSCSLESTLYDVVSRVAELYQTCLNKPTLPVLGVVHAKTGEPVAWHRDSGNTVRDAGGRVTLQVWKKTSKCWIPAICGVCLLVNSVPHDGAPAPEPRRQLEEAVIPFSSDKPGYCVPSGARQRGEHSGPDAHHFRLCNKHNLQLKPKAQTAPHGSTVCALHVYGQIHGLKLKLKDSSIPGRATPSKLAGHGVTSCPCHMPSCSSTAMALAARFWSVAGAFSQPIPRHPRWPCVQARAPSSASGADKHRMLVGMDGRSTEHGDGVVGDRGAAAGAGGAGAGSRAAAGSENGAPGPEEPPTPARALTAAGSGQGTGERFQYQCVPTDPHEGTACFDHVTWNLYPVTDTVCITPGRLRQALLQAAATGSGGRRLALHVTCRDDDETAYDQLRDASVFIRNDGAVSVALPSSINVTKLLSAGRATEFTVTLYRMVGQAQPAPENAAAQLTLRVVSEDDLGEEEAERIHVAKRATCRGAMGRALNAGYASTRESPAGSKKRKRAQGGPSESDHDTGHRHCTARRTSSTGIHAADASHQSSSVDSGQSTSDDGDWIMCEAASGLAMSEPSSPSNGGNTPGERALGQQAAQASEAPDSASAPPKHGQRLLILLRHIVTLNTASSRLAAKFPSRHSHSAALWDTLTTRGGYTMAHVAAFLGDVAALHFLVHTLHADMSRVAVGVSTPLDTDAGEKLGSCDVVGVALPWGTPLDVARAAGHAACVALLEDAAARAPTTTDSAADQPPATGAMLRWVVGSAGDSGACEAGDPAAPALGFSKHSHVIEEQPVDPLPEPLPQAALDGAEQVLRTWHTLRPDVDVRATTVRMAGLALQQGGTRGTTVAERGYLEGGDMQPAEPKPEPTTVMANSEAALVSNTWRKLRHDVAPTAARVAGLSLEQAEARKSAAAVRAEGGALTVSPTAVWEQMRPGDREPSTAHGVRDILVGMGDAAAPDVRVNQLDQETKAVPHRGPGDKPAPPGADDGSTRPELVHDRVAQAPASATAAWEARLKPLIQVDSSTSPPTSRPPTELKEQMRRRAMPWMGPAIAAALEGMHSPAPARGRRCVTGGQTQSRTKGGLPPAMAVHGTPATQVTPVAVPRAVWDRFSHNLNRTSASSIIQRIASTADVGVAAADALRLADEATKEELPLVRVYVAGVRGVGKSTLVHAWLRGTLPELAAYEPTQSSFREYELAPGRPFSDKLVVRDLPGYPGEGPSQTTDSAQARYREEMEHGYWRTHKLAEACLILLVVNKDYPKSATAGDRWLLARAKQGRKRVIVIRTDKPAPAPSAPGILSFVQSAFEYAWGSRAVQSGSADESKAAADADKLPAPTTLVQVNKPSSVRKAMGKAIGKAAREQGGMTAVWLAAQLVPGTAPTTPQVAAIWALLTPFRVLGAKLVEHTAHSATTPPWAVAVVMAAHRSASRWFGSAPTLDVPQGGDAGTAAGAARLLLAFLSHTASPKPTDWSTAIDMACQSVVDGGIQAAMATIALSHPTNMGRKPQRDRASLGHKLRGSSEREGLTSLDALAAQPALGEG